MSEVPVAQRVQLETCVASYREAGSGCPVVLVPGLGLTGRFYEGSFGAFARAGLRLIVPDLPGTGDTPGPRGGIDAEHAAAFMIEFATALRLDPAVFVGHSLGTQSVLLLAMHAPALVRGFVLVGPTGGDGKGKLLRQARGLALESMRVHPGVIGAVVREYMHVSPRKYLGTWIRHRHGVAEGRFSEIACPALLLLGTRDAVISRDYTALLQSELCNVTTVELAGATHALPRSQQEEFNATVVSFAKRVCS